MKHYRHGDLGITPITTIPAGELETVSEKILAFGEATGHHHTLSANPGTIIEVLKGFDEIAYFRVTGGLATLTHQEHNTLSIEPGTYEIHREREYSYFDEALARVLD